MKYDLQHKLEKNLRLHMLTGSLSLLDVLTRNEIRIEERLMINFEIVEKTYHSEEINAIAFVRSEFSVADALTKTKNPRLLNSDSNIQQN